VTAGHDAAGHDAATTRHIDQIDAALRARGSPGRAEHEKTYLKSELEHYGTGVPAIRSVAREVASQHHGLSHDDLLGLVDALWAAPVHERRMVAVELPGIYHERLRSQDIAFLEHLLRESRTWALVGWVLRDTARKRPGLVYTWLLPRAARASAVTIREAIKPLPESQRVAVTRARQDL